MESGKLIGVRLTVKAINEELAKRGSGARLEKGDGYFYFSGGEAADWLDRTVNAPNLSSLANRAAARSRPWDRNHS